MKGKEYILSGSANTLPEFLLELVGHRQVFMSIDDVGLAEQVDACYARCLYRQRCCRLRSAVSIFIISTVASRRLKP